MFCCAATPRARTGTGPSWKSNSHVDWLNPTGTYVHVLYACFGLPECSLSKFVSGIFCGRCKCLDCVFALDTQREFELFVYVICDCGYAICTWQSAFCIVCSLLTYFPRCCVCIHVFENARTQPHTSRIQVHTHVATRIDSLTCCV